MSYLGTMGLYWLPVKVEYGKSVTANTDIWITPITNILKNTSTDVSTYTIQVTPQTDGKLILIDSNGDSKYLAGSATYDWEAGVPILVTYLMGIDDSFNLQYSVTTTFSDVVIMEGGTIY